MSFYLSMRPEREQLGDDVIFASDKIVNDLSESTIQTFCQTGTDGEQQERIIYTDDGKYFSEYNQYPIYCKQ